MRLAAVALAATMMASAAPAMAGGGYLSPAELPVITWLPPPPPEGSVSEAADVRAYLAARQQLPLARGAEAVQDDVYSPKHVVARFAPELGFRLDETNAAHLLALMDRVMQDKEATLSPLKRPTSEGGRIRPFVRFASLPACPHDRPDQASLAQSGSYPSGHAMLGWVWALLLSEAVPDRASALMAKGYEFGESRLICGFHFPSDLDSGRLAASALVARLHGTPEFGRDWRVALSEVSRARQAQLKR